MSGGTYGKFTITNYVSVPLCENYCTQGHVGTVKFG